MEGYGPTNGTPKKVGLILTGVNPFVVDIVANEIIDLECNKVTTVRKSVERGLCSGTLEDIEILGEALDNVYVKDFKKPTVKLASIFTTFYYRNFHLNG